MNTNIKPQLLAELMLERSICSVQVGAVICDNRGIFGWGWNHAGSTGMGEHAEVSALRRSNRKRQRGSILYVASQRNRNEKTIISKPCLYCQGWIAARGIGHVYWRDGDGSWKKL